MTNSRALSTYLTVSRLIAPLAPMVLRQRLKRGKEDPDRMSERLGEASLPRPDGPLIWLHAASVGEAVSLLPLIETLSSNTDAAFLLTTGTVTSAQRMVTDLPPRARHQYVPLDTAPAVTSFLDHWRPDLAIWVESELWPRLIHDTAARGIPLALVNGRVSAKSAKNWSYAPKMAAHLMQSFSRIWTQDTESAERIVDLGGKAEFGGNLKALVAPPSADATEMGEFQAIFGNRPVWFAASTHPGEEEIIAQAQSQILRKSPGTMLIVAPRHLDRADIAADALRSTGLLVARRSSGDPLGGSAQVLFADTMGEMGLWYRLAKVTFVGGSLVDAGGHTPFEPTALGSAVVHGPHVSNFGPTYETFDTQDAALQVGDAATLAVAVRTLLEEHAARERMVMRARVVQKGLGPDLEHLSSELIALMGKGG